MDLIEIDAASHRGIDEIRELRDGIRFTPSKAKYKIFILDESHQLTKEAANALLKTLEEPPAHAIFILATTEIHKMIPTIISRCQRFDFRKLTVPEIVQKLEFIAAKENLKIEKEALELIALNADGSIRDAESILDQILSYHNVLNNHQSVKVADVKEILGLVEMSIVSQFCDLLLQKKVGPVISFLNELAEKGMDLQEFTKSLINYLRQALILKISGIENPSLSNPLIVGLTKEELAKLQSQTRAFQENELQRIINLFLDAQNKIKYSSIPQLPLELAIIEAIGLTNN
jgi:DNA polymerase-3 subunit gamma/tau